MAMKKIEVNVDLIVADINSIKAHLEELQTAIFSAEISDGRVKSIVLTQSILAWRDLNEIKVYFHDPSKM